MDNIFETIVDYCRPSTKVMPLDAIWITDPVLTIERDNVIGRQCRLVEGDNVRVEDNKLVNVSVDNPATHKITGVFGNIQNTILEFTLIDLKTQELITLKL